MGGFNFSDPLDPHFGPNPRWPPFAVGGTSNFFPMGDKFKILFSRIGFWATGNALELFTTLCARYLAEFGGI